MIFWKHPSPPPSVTFCYCTVTRRHMAHWFEPTQGHFSSLISPHCPLRLLGPCACLAPVLAWPLRLLGPCACLAPALACPCACLAPALACPCACLSLRLLGPCACLAPAFAWPLRLLGPCACLAQFSLNNVHKGGLKQHHLIYIFPQIFAGKCTMCV